METLLPPCSRVQWVEVSGRGKEHRAIGIYRGHSMVSQFDITHNALTGALGIKRPTPNSIGSISGASMPLKPSPHRPPLLTPAD